MKDFEPRPKKKAKIAQDKKYGGKKVIKSKLEEW